MVEADAVRATAVASSSIDTTSVDGALRSIEEQTGQTLAFLDTLTQYHGAIADYALATLPSEVSSEQLARLLAER